MHPRSRGDLLRVPLPPRPACPDPFHCLELRAAQLQQGLSPYQATHAVRPVLGRMPTEAEGASPHLNCKHQCYKGLLLHSPASWSALDSSVGCTCPLALGIRSISLQTATGPLGGLMYLRLEESMDVSPSARPTAEILSLQDLSPSAEPTLARSALVLMGGMVPSFMTVASVSLLTCTISRVTR